MAAIIEQDSVTPAALDTETTLHEIDPSSGVYSCQVDLNNLAAGDVTILRMYNQVVDGTYRLAREAVYANVQNLKIAEFLPVEAMYAVKWTVEQTDGTARAYPFIVTQLG